MIATAPSSSTVPRLRWTRLVLVELVYLVGVLAVWTALQLAQGARALDAIEVGTATAVVAAALSTGVGLYRRRERYRPNPYHLTRDQREEAVDALTPGAPIPSDPRVRGEALRLARSLRQETGGGGRLLLVLLVVVLLVFGVLGTIGSRWWLLADAGFALGLLQVPLRVRQGARLDELERLAASRDPAP